MARKTPPRKRRAVKRRTMPNAKAIQLHVRHHERTKKALLRLVKEMEDKKRRLEEGAGLVLDKQAAAMIIDLLNDFLLRVRLVLGAIMACIAIYNAMSATVSALENPNLTDAEREQFHQNLEGLIGDAATLGCP